jgi:hypothetical protein
MSEETFDAFLDRYAGPGAGLPEIQVGDSGADWPAIVVRFGDKTAVVKFCGVGADGNHPYLCIDIYAFVANMMARSSVLGREIGRSYQGFDDTTPGTSHGAPAVRGATVVIGTQTTRPSDPQR